MGGATHTPDDLRLALAQDGFGECVPEHELDDIWLAAALGGKSGRIPHVCMSGDCDDLPDIAEWAVAQQYPDDIDLDRTDVQARFAAFVAEACGPDPEPEPDAPVVAEPAPLTLPEPLLARSAPRLLMSSPQPPAPTPQVFATRVPLGGGGGGGGGGLPRLSLEPERDPFQPPPDDDPQDPPPVGSVPLPAGLWLLLSVLGGGFLLARRRVASRP